MNQRKQSSTTRPLTFLMVDSTDHISGKTGLTVAVTLSKDGGSFAAAAGAVTEIGSGWYALAGNATDRGTLGELALHATATGADPTDKAYVIVPWDPFDGNLSLTGLTGLTTPTAGKLPTSGTGADQISLSSGKVAEVALCDALTTNNDKADYALTTAYDPAKTAAQAGDSMKVSVGTGAGQVNVAGGKVPATLAEADVAGNLPSVLADGVAHGGTPGASTATLALKWMDVNNPDGDGITATGGAGSGMRLDGTAGGYPGLWATGSPGVFMQGTVDDSNGLRIVGQLAPGTSSTGGAGYPGLLVGGGTGASGVVVHGNGSGTWSIELPANAGSAAGILGDLFGIIDGLSAAGLATLFDVDSTRTYADAVTGSPVKEIASNAGGGGSDPDVALSGTLGGQGAGSVDAIVLPSGPAANGALVGSRLRITSGAAQYQERTIATWDGTGKIAGIDETFTGGTPASGDTFEVRYDHSHQIESGNVLSVGQVSSFQAGALAQFFTLDSTKVYADAVTGSIVKEMTASYTAPDNAGILAAIATRQATLAAVEHGETFEKAFSLMFSTVVSGKTTGPAAGQAGTFLVTEGTTQRVSAPVTADGYRTTAPTLTAP